VELILAWRADVEAWKAQGRRLKTRKQLARELGVSETTI
jgi:DNA-binding CsgD family transcriptional regulator